MDWIVPAFVGFVLGLVSSLATVWVQRQWQKKDDADYTEKVVASLITEIEEGIVRAKYMVNLLDDNALSLSRIYTQIWQSTSQRLAATLEKTEILTLLHRIYYRFDLINFNCERERPGPGAAFAKQYLPEIEENLYNLRALVQPR